MKRIISSLISAVLLLSVLLLSACDVTDPKAQTASFYNSLDPEGRYFRTYCEYRDYSGASATVFAERRRALEEEIIACNRLFDIYNTYDGINNLKTVNDAAGGEAVRVDGRIIELLTLAKDAYTLTDGNVNVMMGSVLTLWHGCREAAREGEAALPDMAALRAAAEHTSIDSLVIDRAASTVRITDPAASLDVGAVAKGYAAERCAALLEEMGVFAYSLDFGGNLRVGEKLSGKPFTTGIRNPVPYSSESFVRILDISDEALVTSGVDQNFYVVDGVRYHHIINKDTLMPKNDYLSVSIRTPSSAWADALSTALFNMTVDEGRAVIGELEDTSVTYVFPDGEVLIIGAEA